MPVFWSWLPLCLISRSCWYCPSCGDGPYAYEHMNACRTCGTVKSEALDLIEKPYHKRFESIKNEDDNALKSSPLQRPGNDDATPWYECGHSAWTGSLVQVGLFSLASAAALDAGDNYGSWSSMPWSPLNCHEPRASDHTSVSDGAFCGGHTVASTFIYATAATAIHQWNCHDCCQDACLFAGITLGIGIGLFLETNLEAMIFGILPWVILGSLLCSIMGHKIWVCCGLCVSVGT